MRCMFYQVIDGRFSGHRLLNEKGETPDDFCILLHNHLDRFCVHLKRHCPETEEVRMGQHLFKHCEEDRRNLGGMGVDPFRKLLSHLSITNRFMAGQSRYMDFYDPLQRKFVEEVLDKSFESSPSAGSGISINGPEVSDVQYEAAGHRSCHESEKIVNRYRARGKVCERRHFQEKQRRRSISPPTLIIYRLLNHRNIIGDDLGTQRRLERRDIGAERMADRKRGVEGKIG